MQKPFGQCIPELHWGLGIRYILGMEFWKSGLVLGILGFQSDGKGLLKSWRPKEVILDDSFANLRLQSVPDLI